ncbi:hypothetical protein PPSIR1_03523 [Plesiocystis pacifica SIR-1]|uniref:Uncharacterized protein n=1 Tax=Plesiocystis pacifica SIR-1 TaxID=391625 RepID=A6G5G4_9BACT|nr:hypothetical protein [Plesiocystis pacifica]EDM78907.1 hypothetical protein PPSIR1_03523 [Plesiocystis pacifica SIR-1]
MDPSITSTVVDALPSGGSKDSRVDLSELQRELEAVAAEALDARMRGIDLVTAVHDDEGFPQLAQFHRELRDALLVEIPKDLQPWVAAIAGDEARERLAPKANARKAKALAKLDEQRGALTERLSMLHDDLFMRAHTDPEDAGDGDAQLQSALSELLVFEAVRLQLLVTVWSSTDFESLGGDERAIDHIAWAEVEALIAEPAMTDEAVRPLPVMVAASNLALVKDAAERVEALRLVSEDQRETLRMRARLRAALRELRLPESVLLENALAGLLGEDRLELTELQEQRAMALEGLSRQAMDQRVSRGRRALRQPPEKWPSRRKPALFDLLRSAPSED